MFASAFERLSALWTRRPAAPAPPAPGQAAPATSAPAEPVASLAAAAGSPLAGVGARRPLVTADATLAGFEFRLADVLVRRAGAAAQAAYTQAILTAMRATAAGGGVALTELPARWLLQPAAVAAMCPGMLLCLRHDDDGDDPAVLDHAAQVARRGGARVGWLIDRHDDTPDSARPADFLLLRPGQQWPVATLLQAIPQRTTTPPRCSVVATDLPDVQSVERALALGASYATGTLTAADDPPQATPVSPQLRRLLDLLSRLMRSDDLAPVARDIKGDVGLALQLLHFAGSARFARGRAVDSVESAVLVVGRDELYRWLSRVLVRSAGGRRASRALQDVTLARARLLELIATRRGEAHPPSLFTLGLASMLPALLHTSIHQATQGLDLVPAARAALLDGDGPWRGHLDLARATERHDFTAADRLAADIGGVATALALAEQAWDWALEQTAAG